ncbi:lysosomal cobalamin transporter ABCD4-like [Antedon mediterranea]|uniref:lysosomal cobalamin transporter ABCD4-like n=1 Tax=Antedon mediterranea TaxID=105859 RepID=UPI003AF77325
MVETSVCHESGKPQQKYTFDLLSWRRFCAILRILFPSLLSSISALFLLLLVSAVGEQIFIYFVGLIPSKFYYVLGYQDLAGFLQETWKALLLIICIALAKSSKQYISSLLAVQWRDLLTSYLQHFYLKDINYYKINVLQVGQIDNPDQRIADDVNQLCTKFSSMVALLVISPFTIIYYTVKVIEVTGYVGPLCIYSFFILTNFINKFIMSPVVNLKVKLDRQEGEFRFKHMQIRSHSETIAFYQAASVEHSSTDHKLSTLLNTLRNYVNREFWLQVSMNVCDYIGSIVSYIIIAIPVFKGEYSHLSPQDISSLVSANSFVCMYLIYSFTQLIDLSNQVSDIAGLSHRIGELMEVLQELDKDEVKPQKESTPKSPLPIFKHQKLINEYSDEDDSKLPKNERMRQNTVIELMNVSVFPPDGKEALIKDLSLVISFGRNILITGDTGSGKTSLLRLLFGLWPHVQGTIHKSNLFNTKNMFTLPQKPYLINGSLEDQIIYPDKKKKRNENLLDVIKLVGLNKLLSRVQDIKDPVPWSWNNVLTPGEMQRISFARLFYHRPKLAFLDESTSALSVTTEASLYEQCLAYDITLVSVGHRDSLRQYHCAELKLYGNGSWRLENISANILTVL